MDHRDLHRLPGRLLGVLGQTTRILLEHYREFLQLSHATLRWLCGVFLLAAVASVFSFFFYCSCRLSCRGIDKVGDWLDGGM